ncbi:DgyrCDS6178 [Dimorphilus gyrociliatus]|uniref:DNA-directed RNA polymerase III subunit RPC9 n=1 Tax=Dimorphilus gyrociliatus TaxID=2664684 RepID=A0A7I8VMF8_9ANNE|nr:DgyrCDS6178 [Dimorphilus gyrociliatus]
MEVVEKTHALLSNHEVLSHLRDIQNGTNDQRKPGRNQQNLATVCYSTVKFLEQTPAVSQSVEIIENFMQKIEPFNLTKAEKLQILNLRPTTQVEIQLLVEECEERLSEDDIEKLLQIVQTCLTTNDQESS